jgi:hypothetical protein
VWRVASSAFALLRHSPLRSAVALSSAWRALAAWCRFALSAFALVRHSPLRSAVALSSAWRALASWCRFALSAFALLRHSSLRSAVALSSAWRALASWCRFSFGFYPRAPVISWRGVSSVRLPAPTRPARAATRRSLPVAGGRFVRLGRLSPRGALWRSLLSSLHLNNGGHILPIRRYVSGHNGYPLFVSPPLLRRPMPLICASKPLGAVLYLVRGATHLYNIRVHAIVMAY